MSFDDCLQKNADLIRAGSHKSFDLIELEKYARQLTKEGKIWHPDNLQKESPDKIIDWDKKIGLFSLSETAENILMWSHYASNHSGFVVGFNVDYFSANPVFHYLEPINYQMAYPIITGLDDTNSQMYKKFFSKSRLWQYEEEWRISINHISKRIVNLDKHAFSQVIIGCKMPEKERAQLITSAKRVFGKKFKIQQAKMSEDSFKLNLERIN